MDIKIDTVQMRELLSQAIFSSLDEVKREVLIKGAIEHLVTKSTNSYDRGVSPIEAAFNVAVRTVAEKIAGDMLTKDAAVAEKIRALMNEALVRLMETNREVTVQKLADAIALGMAYRER